MAFDRVGAVAGYPATAPSCSVVAPAIHVVGTYPTRCSGPASDANYDYTYLDGVLTVARAAVTVRASSPTMHLGDVVPEVGAAVDERESTASCPPCPCAAPGRWSVPARW